MLFVKKSDDEGSDFYYLGNMIYNSFEDTKMNSEKDGKIEKVPVVNIQFRMKNPVPQQLYNYLESWYFYKKRTEKNGQRKYNKKRF